MLEKELHGEIYKLNFVTERKSLVTGGQSVLENKEIMERNNVFIFNIENHKLHRQSADNYWLCNKYVKINEIWYVINVKRSMSIGNESK